VTTSLGRRAFTQGALVAACGAAVGAALGARGASAAPPGRRYVALPPGGFVPLAVPGRVVKVTKGTDFPALMQGNLLWPRPDVARQMLERALTELTGAPTLVDAMRRLVHPEDVVAIKVNGIAGQLAATMAVNFELILPVVEAVLAVGVPPHRVTVFEQHPAYLAGTRVGTKGHALPDGVKAEVHRNRDARMPEIPVYAGVETRFVRQVTDATALIDMTMMKDHALAGFTGALKNTAYGVIVNPHAHHAHGCSPQIPVLYNHPILRSRVRLHLVDAFKITYDGGPLDRLPERRIPHGAVYAATDPVALDTVGWDVIEEARRVNGLPTLARAGREPAYIRAAADLGLGVHDRNTIRLRQVAL
jgi:uncharacterized protein (DUF362 family)